VAADLGVTQAQLAIGWLLRLPQVTSVITGATSRKQVEDNLAAIDVPARLDGDVLKRIETILENRPG
jgi:aryl-alcohol dehydrogenase-like predicted oxidoreductase